MKKVVLALITLVIAVLGVYSFIQTKAVQPAPVQEATIVQPTPPAVDELLRLVNEERAKAGVAPLRLDERLNQSAQRKADELAVDGLDDTPHVKDGVHGYSYAQEAVPNCGVASENLLYNAYTAKDGIEWWKSSKPHYEAMISPNYVATGFGIKNGYIAEHFCSGS